MCLELNPVNVLLIMSMPKCWRGKRNDYLNPLKESEVFSLFPHEHLIVLVKCARKIGGAKRKGTLRVGWIFLGGGGGYLRHKGWLICYEKVSIATNLQLLKCILLNKILGTYQTLFQV